MHMQPGTDMADELIVAARSSKCPGLYQNAAAELNKAAVNAIALRFSEDAMLELNGAWAYGQRLLTLSARILACT